MSNEEEDANVLKALSEISTISDELKSLEAKDDLASRKRCLELEDALMTIDMGLRPFKMKMNDRELFWRGWVRMGRLACKHLGNIADFAWEAAAASAKVARRRGRE